MMVEEVSEVIEGLVVESFVSEEQEFELDEVRDRKPVGILKNRGDMVTGVSVGEEESSRVVDIELWKFTGDFG